MNVGIEIRRKNAPTYYVAKEGDTPQYNLYLLFTPDPYNPDDGFLGHYDSLMINNPANLPKQPLPRNAQRLLS